MLFLFDNNKTRKGAEYVFLFSILHDTIHIESQSNRKGKRDGRSCVVCFRRKRVCRWSPEKCWLDIGSYMIRDENLSACHRFEREKKTIGVGRIGSETHFRFNAASSIEIISSIANNHAVQTDRDAQEMNPLHF